MYFFVFSNHYIGSPQIGDFPPEETLAILGDISNCHILREVTTGISWVGSMDIAKQPVMNRTARLPIYKDFSGPNISNAKDETLCSILNTHFFLIRKNRALKPQGKCLNNRIYKANLLRQITFKNINKHYLSIRNWQSHNIKLLLLL